MSSTNAVSDLQKFANKYGAHGTSNINYSASSSSSSSQSAANNTSSASSSSSHPSHFFSGLTDKFSERIPLFQSASSSANTASTHPSTSIASSQITSSNNKGTTTTSTASNDLTNGAVVTTTSGMFGSVTEWWNPSQAPANDSTILSHFGECLNLSWKQRIIGFLMSFVTGLLFLSFSFLYLPQIMLGMSAKFAISYAMTNICFLLSSCFLVGPVKQATNMFSEGRWLASIIYIVTLFGVLYSAYKYRSFYVVIPMLVVQFLALFYYLMTYLPGGMANTMIIKVIKGMFSGCIRTTRSILPI